MLTSLKEVTVEDADNKSSAPKNITKLSTMRWTVRANFFQLSNVSTVLIETSPQNLRLTNLKMLWNILKYFRLKSEKFSAFARNPFGELTALPKIPSCLIIFHNAKNVQPLHFHFYSSGLLHYLHILTYNWSRDSLPVSMEMVAVKRRNELGIFFYFITCHVFSFLFLMLFFFRKLHWMYLRQFERANNKASVLLQ